MKQNQKSTLTKIKVILALIILIAIIAINGSIIRHFHNFLIISKNFWQTRYDSVVTIFDGNDFYLNVWATFIWSQTVYWTAGLFYTILDVTHWPRFLYKYKIQNTNVSYRQIIPVLKQVTINHFVVGLPTAVLYHYVIVWRESDKSPRLPTLYKILFDLFLFVVIEEIGFYYTHRLLHSKRLYKHVHKRHHEWQSPIAITAVYCHPFEHFMSNLFPVILGPLILGSHRITYWIWLTIVLLSTLNDHSGYHFPFMPSPEFHDFHHLKFTQNYGVIGILDRIHGTDSTFRKALEFKRHRMLTNLVPIKLSYPD